MRGSVRTGHVLTAAVAALTLAACGASGGSATESGSAAAGATGTAADLLPERVKDRGHLVVGGSTSVAPYLFEEGGKVVGFEREFMDLLEKELGVKVELQDTGFAALVPSLQSKRIDVAMGDFTDTLERQAAVDFIDYTKSYQGLLVQKGNPKGIADVDSLCGSKVAGAQGSLSLKLAEEQNTACEKDGKPGVDILAMEDAGASTLAVQSGRADAVVIDYTIATYVSQEQGKTEVAGEPLHPQFHGAAVRKDDDEMEAALMAAFKAIMEDGSYDAILKDWKLTDLAMDAPALNAAKE